MHFKKNLNQKKKNDLSDNLRHKTVCNEKEGLTYNYRSSSVLPFIAKLVTAKFPKIL